MGPSRNNMVEEDIGYLIKIYGTLIAIICVNLVEMIL